jgi:hypothetical protein
MARTSQVPVALVLTISAVAFMAALPLSHAQLHSDFGIGQGVNAGTICTLSNSNPAQLSALMSVAATQAMSTGTVQAFAAGLVNGLLSAHQQGCRDNFFPAVGGAVAMGGAPTTTAVGMAFAMAPGSSVTPQGVATRSVQDVLASATANIICKGSSRTSGIAAAWNQAVAMHPSTCAALTMGLARSSIRCTASAATYGFSSPMNQCDVLSASSPSRV